MDWNWLGHRLVVLMIRATIQDMKDGLRVYKVNIEIDPSEDRTYMIVLKQVKPRDKWLYTITNVSGGEYEKNRYPTQVKEIADDLTATLNRN